MIKVLRSLPLVWWDSPESLPVLEGDPSSFWEQGGRCVDFALILCHFLLEIPVVSCKRPHPTVASWSRPEGDCFGLPRAGQGRCLDRAEIGGGTAYSQLHFLLHLPFVCLC